MPGGGRFNAVGADRPAGRLSRLMDDRLAPDMAVAEIAKRQHGALSVAQLRKAGLSKTAVMNRCRAGRLHRLHRGVYAVGHIAPSRERTWMAAVLALGGGAVLSHRSAAALWQLLPETSGPVDVSLPGRNGRSSRLGIRVHRPLSLVDTDLARRRGIPVTSPPRTLVDLRATSSSREFRRAVHQAEFLGLPTGPGIDSDRTRSELERRFLWLCRRNHLPRPQVNIRVAGMTVDFCWLEQKVIVETDGYRYHRGRESFEGGSGPRSDAAKARV
jgi:hypothetical protein